MHLISQKPKLGQSQASSPKGSLAVPPFLARTSYVKQEWYKGNPLDAMKTGSGIKGKDAVIVENACFAMQCDG